MASVLEQHNTRSLNEKRGKRTRKKKLAQPNEKKDGEISPELVAVRCNKLGVGLAPVISKDSKHVICACGKIVAIYRRKTGLLENTFDGHQTPINSLFLNEADPLQVISCSEREMIIWDYNDLTIAKKYHLRVASSGCFQSSLKPNFVFCKTQDDSNKKQAVLMQCSLKKPYTTTKMGPVSKNNKSAVVSLNGRYIAFIFKEKLSVYSISKEECFVHNYDDVHLACVAFHPNPKHVATGDMNGKIIVWYNVCRPTKQVQSVLLHWHNSPVNDLLFTNDANYLMSGGTEGVLVIWQLETQHKTFVPRIGGAINDIFQSSDSMFVGVTLDCNMIKILSAVDTKLTKTIKFLSEADDLSAGLTYDPKSECVVTNDKASGVLQFYQPAQDIVKLNLDVVGENLISSVQERLVYPTRVRHVAFSDDGIWMATVDVREDRILPVERKLKFWKYSEKEKSYTLNTLVNPPHEDEVYSAVFRPLNKTSKYSHMVATTSKDGYIKTWVLQVGKDSQDKPVETWQLHSLGSYDKESCKQACFSSDGSLLAVLFSEVTLWDPETLALQTNLAWNLPHENIKAISFGCHDSSQFLIGYSVNYLIVWDIKTCSVKWQMEADVQLLAVDPYSKYFATCIRFEGDHKTHVYVFNPASPSPAALFYKINKHFDVPKAAIFTPRKKPLNFKNVWEEMGHFYILTNSTEIITIKERREIEDEKNKKKIDVDDSQTSNFEDIFGVTSKGKQSIKSSTPDIPLGNPSSVVLRKMMSTPAHVLPSVDVLCKTLMKSLLIQTPKAKSGKKEEKRENDEDSDDQMEASDSDVEVTNDERQVAVSGDKNDDDVDNDDEKDVHFQLPDYNFDFLE
ncbi:WD repeat-containing protein 75-like isoform X2 [Hydractinia symbiolongicarpus]|uniref:WD repeat-containing protein 75-like isoform X2 n=1 Tax=Hydractinia symbiolongicarpus TaxID=13093 RepID=UPI00254C2257|nr:WD repeat-containing protein 75-like isoform X2 [Hydractinia symbiolongicarpus]